MRLKNEILEINSEISLVEEGDDGFACVFSEGDYMVCIIASWGGGWDHVSVHMAADETEKSPIIGGPDKRGMKTVIPSWMMMSRIKSMFFYDYEWALQYHPAIKEYVNDHDATLHLWRPQGQEIPKPPKSFV